MISSPEFYQELKDKEHLYTGSAELQPTFSEKFKELLEKPQSKLGALLDKIAPKKIKIFEGPRPTYDDIYNAIRQSDKKTKLQQKKMSNKQDQLGNVALNAFRKKLP